MIRKILLTLSFVCLFFLMSCYPLRSMLFTIYDLNENNSLGDLKCIAVDYQDNIFAIGGQGNQIIQIKENGEHRVIYEILNKGNETSIIDLAIDNIGNFYAIESNGHILIIDTDGSLIREWYEDSKEVQFQAVAIDSHNNLYITDRKNDCILKYAPDGTLLREYKDEDYIFDPQGIYIDSEDNIYFGFVQDIGLLIQYDQADIFTVLLDTYHPRIIYIDNSNRIYLGNNHTMAIYASDYEERLDLFNGEDRNIFPEAEDIDIIDFAVTSKGRIFVIRDNKIIVCDKYNEGNNQYRGY